MIVTSKSARPHETNTVESIVRMVLEGGELSPGTEAHLRWQMLCGNLSGRDRDLIYLLQDAIQDGCVQRPCSEGEGLCR
ncbi:MAG: hypothetical protein HY785_24275 [Oscillatoriophycideae cyanobacterium NC_groundwater_1537_Pr4_S-0.65um_50_18]|nr:hypothetical protein [Oscillatoriophycideae cyanobacterium NC_groundwater_1537_Pr4_S-0.65um_50_18]